HSLLRDELKVPDSHAGTVVLFGHRDSRRKMAHSHPASTTESHESVAGFSDEVGEHRGQLVTHPDSCMSFLLALPVPTRDIPLRCDADRCLIRMTISCEDHGL